MPIKDPIDATLEAADAPAPDSDKKPDSPPKLNGASRKYALKRALKEFGSDGGTDLAAMLTYYTVLSLAPALLAIFSIITLVLASNAETVTALVDDLVKQYVPADYQSLVVNLVETMTSSAGCPFAIRASLTMPACVVASRLPPVAARTSMSWSSTASSCAVFQGACAVGPPSSSAVRGPCSSSPASVSLLL